MVDDANALPLLVSQRLPCATCKHGPACAQVPGNIRRAEHFCSFLRQLVSYMRERISVQAVEQESCTAFLAALQEQMSVDGAHVSDC